AALTTYLDQLAGQRPGQNIEQETGVKREVVGVPAQRGGQQFQVKVRRWPILRHPTSLTSANTVEPAVEVRTPSYDRLGESRSGTRTVSAAGTTRPLIRVTESRSPPSSSYVMGAPNVASTFWARVVLTNGDR